ncbi:MAG: methyltransferase, partial [Clostridiaceae bacterium]|nr:methyltransferase [Clostridiaceae bacterium]
MSHHSHYYDHDPKAGHDFQDILFRMEDHDFLFRTDRAVFSRERVDPGTALLLSSILKEEKDRPVNLLDLGTGVGVMALVLARLRPSFHLTGIDVNRRALDLAAFNARRAGLSSKVSFLESDGIPQGLVFDLIIS